MIILIRHGETDWNRQKKVQGREDIPLNTHGILQANLCGQALENTPVDRILTSPLKRAKETAKIIGHYVSLKEIEEVENLIEKDYGRMSGISYALKEQYKLTHPDNDVESFSSVSSRMMEVIYDCMEYAKDHNVVMVSHGASINTVLAVLSGCEIGTGITKLKNTCMNLLDCTGTRVKILEYNLSPEEYVNRELFAG